MIPSDVVSAKPYQKFGREQIEQPLTSRFQAQVQRYSDGPAISDPQLTWTYRELDSRSNAVASALLTAVGPNPGRIALLFEQGAPMVAGMLGVLKANKSYVPLDPLHPKLRLQFILQDAGVAAIVCGESCLGIAKSCTEIRTPIINFDELEPQIDSPEVCRSPASETYVLYTSGSTGQPKGVLQCDRNVLHFIAAYTNALHLDSTDRLTLFPSYGFDASVMDIYGALLNGAFLHVRDLRRAGMGALDDWISVKNITVWHSTPTVFRVATSTFRRVAPSSLRLVVLGGEEAAPADLTLLKDHFDERCILVNGYGPTESTVTLQYFAKTESVNLARLPIGYPVEETRVFLLDPNGKPADSVGEVAISSPYVALGYLNRPDLTAERFSLSPFDPNARLYRTGDMARRRPDGALEFVGRTDSQVKVKGFRIELAEIEAALRDHCDLHDAVVLARESEAGSKLLVAYVVAKDSGADAANLRAFLGTRLPDYMIPASFVHLDMMPTTPNGKIDKRELAQYPLPSLQGNATYVAPKTDLEQRLVDAFEKIFAVHPISTNSSFIDLGGDSLSFIRASIAIEDIVRYVPDNWDSLSIRDVVSSAKGKSPIDHDSSQADIVGQKAQLRRTTRTQLASMETSVFFRAISIILVVCGHFQLFTFTTSIGAVTGLLVISGLSLARFQFKAVEKIGSITPLVAFMMRVALPTFLYTLLLQWVFSSFRYETLFFFDNFLDPLFNRGFSAWYIELLLQNTAVLAAILAFPAIRSGAVENPFGFGIALLVTSWLASLIVPFFWDTSSLYDRVPHVTLWVMAIGWCIAYADTGAKKAATTAAFLFMYIISTWYNRQDLGEPYFAVPLVLVLIWVSRFSLPRFSIPTINNVAGASLFIYITHGQFHSLLKKIMTEPPPVLSVVFALFGGVLVWWGWDHITRIVRRRFNSLYKENPALFGR